MVYVGNEVPREKVAQRDGRVQLVQRAWLAIRVAPVQLVLAGTLGVLGTLDTRVQRDRPGGLQTQVRLDPQGEWDFRERPGLVVIEG